MVRISSYKLTVASIAYGGGRTACRPRARKFDVLCVCVCVSLLVHHDFERHSFSVIEQELSKC